MARRRGQRQGWLRVENGSWLLTYREYCYDPERKKSVPHRITVTIGPASGPGKLTEKQAQRFAWDHYLSKVDHVAMKPMSSVTVDEFWRRKFEAHMDLHLKVATRKQYRSLYATWIKPVIGDVRMYELSPDHVETVIAKVAASKAASTVGHVHKVVSAIVTYAKGLQYFSGDNPATVIKVPEGLPVRPARALTWEQCQSVLNATDGALHAMILLSVSCSLNVSEMTGLRIKHLNLTDQYKVLDSETIPPFHMAVREHCYRGARGTLKAGSRKRNVPLSDELVEKLKTLLDRKKFTNSEDPVFVSRAGTALNENNVRNRHLKPTAIKLEMPWLSWHSFRHTHATLSQEIGMIASDRMALMGHASLEMTDRYTHEDRERMRAGVQKISSRILLASTGTDGATGQAPKPKVITITRGKK